MATSHAKYDVLEARTLSQDEYAHEAWQCMALYNSYVSMLARKLNQIHNVEYSERYWNTLLNRFLYPLIATVMDKVLHLQGVAKMYPELVADTVDYHADWLNPHTVQGFGDSRILHLLLFSIVVETSNIVRSDIIDSAAIQRALAQMGDGKKCSKNKRGGYVSQLQRMTKSLKNYVSFLSPVKQMAKGELPLRMLRYVRSPIVALGDQYLSRGAREELLVKSGGSRYYFNAREWDTDDFKNPDRELRRQLCFGEAVTPFDLAIQEALRVLLPTVYLENFEKARTKVQKILPKKRTVILNSQNCGGRELLDFFIAHSVEEKQSHHMMICHGGCFGAMEVSVQDQIWVQISDSYVLWSNPKVYGPECDFVKLPSLRFHKWSCDRQKDRLGDDVLVFLTGRYPNRYAYNSMFPYTIDESYDEWQIRFLSAVCEKDRKSLVIRDYHRSFDVNQGSVQAWAHAHNVRVSANKPLAQALRLSKLAIQTVPQTTYLETISADHPTICYWNPSANLIRSDLQPYYEKLRDAGVLHDSPEAAAAHLHKIIDDPLVWWKCPQVSDAVQSFKDNVCYTAPDTIPQWVAHLSRMIERPCFS